MQGKDYFLLQNKWNNFFKKTCGCKAQYYCKFFLLKGRKKRQPTKKK